MDCENIVPNICGNRGLFIPEECPTEMKPSWCGDDYALLHMTYCEGEN